MSESEEYDPAPDLAALQSSGAGRIAQFFMVIVAVLELGVYFQTRMLASHHLGISLWFRAKLLLAVVALGVAFRASRLRAGADVLWIFVSLATTAEAIAWVVFSFAEGFYSCFSPTLIGPAAICLFASGFVRRDVQRAAGARARLLDHDYGRVF